MHTTTSKSTTSACAYTRKTFLSLGAAGTGALLSACNASTSSDSEDSETEIVPTGALAFDMDAWNYDEDNDAWWQVGVTYCEEPATEDYETLGIYVPGAYLSGEANDDGTYSCTVDDSGEAGGHTAADAPIVIPINTAGYSAQEAPTSYNYESVSDYLEAGFVYVYPGCRGRANGYDDDSELIYAGGAPWGVVDLKAAVRYLRYNSSLLPGDMGSIFTFGHSGGGAQSSLMGVTGDAEAFEPYLAEIGAAGTGDDDVTVSDAIAGSMCWCPITCLDGADAAYEWMMGQFGSSGTRAEETWTAELSGDLADAYASYLDTLELQNTDGETLSLETSDDGHYCAGTYHDAVVELVERSLNNFLEDTEFPYTASSQTMADGGFGAGLAGGDAEGAPSDEAPDDDTADGDAPDGDLPDSDAADGDAPGLDADDSDAIDLDAADGDLPEGDLPDAADAETPDGTMLLDGLDSADATDSDAAASDDESSSGETYETAADYIDALNADEEWASYDEDTGTATVLDLGGFVRACKPAGKDVGAFDATDRSQAENDLFGNADEDSLHFDRIMADLLATNADAYAEYEDWDADLPDAYADDLTLEDDLGLTVTERVELYEPLAYLCSAYDLCGTSAVAPHWRIRTGIEQSDTSLCTELNLSLALQASDEVEDVDFETVWGQGHTTAERTGDSTENFISWVEECVAS